MDVGAGAGERIPACGAVALVEGGVRLVGADEIGGGVYNGLVEVEERRLDIGMGIVRCRQLF